MIHDLTEQIDRIMEQRPSTKASLMRYRELLVLMKEIMPEPQNMMFEDRLKDMKKEEGFPLFSREDLPIDFDVSKVLFKRFLEHFAKTDRDDKDGIEKTLKKAQKDTLWVDQLFRAILKMDNKTLDKMGKETGLNPKVLEFLAETAIKPSLHALRSSISEKQLEKTGWDYGYCPLCGSQANMAYLDKAGKRFLHCQLCGEEWQYSRLNCPFCQNEDHKTLGYFQAEQEEGFRVDFCRKCQRYIKTIDKRIFETAGLMELEYLATIHLDLLASEHGFK